MNLYTAKKYLKPGAKIKITCHCSHCSDRENELNPTGRILEVIKIDWEYFPNIHIHTHEYPSTHFFLEEIELCRGDNGIIENEEE